MANTPRIVNNAERSQNDLDRLNTDTRELEVSDKPLGQPADEELVDLDTYAEFWREVDDEATPRTIRSTITEDRLIRSDR
jgi:hypothetical protein